MGRRHSSFNRCDDIVRNFPPEKIPLPKMQSNCDSRRRHVCNRKASPMATTDGEDNSNGRHGVLSENQFADAATPRSFDRTGVENVRPGFFALSVACSRSLSAHSEAGKRGGSALAAAVRRTRPFLRIGLRRCTQQPAPRSIQCGLRRMKRMRRIALTQSDWIRLSHRISRHT